jgi:hypothetical protein
MYAWSQTPPVTEGWYWHCCGPGAPVLPVAVRCGLVLAGQLGLTNDIPTAEYGGWWQRAEVPGMTSTQNREFP